MGLKTTPVLVSMEEVEREVLNLRDSLSVILFLALSLCVYVCVNRMVPLWVHDGSTMGPRWVHDGSTMGPRWVHDGSTLLGTL